jgi:predicted porin
LALAGLAARQIQSKRSERMQKKLLTLAVAGALAAPGLALAQVEVYGTIHMSLNKMKYGEATGGIPSVSKFDVASHASNVGVRARESLGGGQTAWIQVETNASMERSNNIAHTSNFASRNSAIGLQGGWGNLFIGQWTSPWTDLDALWGIGTVATYGPVTSIIGRRETTGAAPNPNCANNFSGNGGVALPGGVTATQATCDSVEGNGGVGHSFWRRISNSVFYQSPVFGGAQVKLAYQTNQDKASVASAGGAVADPSMWSGSVQWAGMGGRLRIGGAFDAHKDFTTVGQTDKGWRVTGGWNFGFADIGVAYEQMTYKTTVDNDATQWGIAIAVPVGQGAIRAAFSRADDIEAGATSVDNGAKQWNIGYDFRFSKRTTVGIGYATIENDSLARFTWSGLSSAQNGQDITPPAGADVDIFFVSMVHRF